MSNTLSKIELPITTSDFDNDPKDVPDLSELMGENDEKEKIQVKHNETSKTKSQMPVVTDLDDPWNPRIQLRLKSIGEKAMGYRWMSYREVTYNQEWHSFYTRLETVLFTIITTIASGEFVTILFEANHTVLIIVSIAELIFLFSHGVAQSLKDKGDYLNKSKHFNDNAAKFNEIYLSILNQLSIPIDRREEGVDYLKEMTDKFNDLMFSPIKVRQETIDQYIKETKNSNIYKPLLVGGLDKIDIVIDAESSKPIIQHQASTHKLNPGMNEKIDHEINRWLAHV